MEGQEKNEQSFLSQQPPNYIENSREEILTELNESRFYKNNAKAEEDLNSEEERYREKLNQMKKKKS